MKRILLSILIPALFISQSTFSQALENLRGPEKIIKGRYSAAWIMHPDITGSEFAVVDFRKHFNLQGVPDHFIIHISADNRYRLFVNGVFAAKGPAKSDLSHWNYETLDLAPLLKTGQNILAAEVVNFGPKRTWSQFSAQTNFFVQGHSEREQIINTAAGSWLAYHNKSTFPRPVDWLGRKDIAFGLYVANPTDSVIAENYPWGWEQPDYDDSAWIYAAWSNNAGGRDSQYAGGINYTVGKLLVPRPTRLLKETAERFTSFARTSGIDPPEGLLEGKKELVIPHDSKITLLIDQKYLTIGYPEIIVSGGKDSRIRVGYAETLFKSDRASKGNRNDLESKIFIGIKDVFIPDGGIRRHFRPLSHRTFRFIQLDIETRNDSLVIHDFYNNFTSYPVKLQASFHCDKNAYNQLMESGWRTAKVCAQDILMSDAYYEQMQYVGDSKIYNMAMMTLTGDDDLVRNQLTQTNWSRIPEGLTLACYPNPFHLVIPYYSLTWIEMIYDHMMWAGDKEFTSRFVLGIYSVLDWYDQRIQNNGLLGPLEWWNDVDWSPGFPNGVPPGIENGNSSLFTLEYAIALKKAAEIMTFTGNLKLAERYRIRASGIIEAVNKLCYDPSRELYAETPEFKNYSQHTNILAILADAVEGDKAVKLMHRILEDKSLDQVALFFRYYLLEALHISNMADQIKNELTPWFQMIDTGLTTFTEVPLTWKSQRSDCHPWSTSPNIHFFTTICGIRPIKPGFAEVEIRPAFGELNSLKAIYPHPKGKIILDLDKENNSLTGTIELDGDYEAYLIWYNQKITLIKGINNIRL